MQSKAWVNDDFDPSDTRRQPEITVQSCLHETAAQGDGTDQSNAPGDDRARHCPSGRRPIDLVHLSAQTCGDRQLEREVLVLLKAQLGVACGRLDAADLEARSVIAHGLKGAALNMGAFPLAESADRLEAAPDDEERLADLLAIIAVTGAMIDRLIA